MKTLNNHDKSSTGVSCQLIAFHDSSTARWEFEESFQVIVSGSHRDTAVYFYLSQGDGRGIGSVEELIDFSGCTAKDFRQALWGVYCELCEMRKEKANERDFVEEYADYELPIDWEDAFMETFMADVSIEEYAVDEENVPLLHNLNGWKPVYEVSASTGYCQGHYALVIHEAGEGIKEAIDHLLWDSPVYARLEIATEDGETLELFLEEYLEDSYSWDKDRVLEALKKRDDAPPEAIEWFEDNAPEEIEHA